MKQQKNIFFLLHLLSGVSLLLSFFLPWVSWKETPIRGMDLASGRFFEVSGSQFGLSNPFPQLDFSFYVFWLIPVLVIIALILSLRGKKAGWPSLLAGALTLALATVFYLFSNTLGDLGIPHQLKIFFWISVLSALVFISAVFPPNNWLKKLGWVLFGPLFAYAGFLYVEKTVWNQTFEDTDDIKAEFSLTAEALLNEFAGNDSAANAKYREKIIEVTGTPTSVETLKDSTVNIKFEDSTGSYIVFPLEKKFYSRAVAVRTGEQITLKGSCSGSIRSEILGTTSISFKRSTLNKK